MRVAWAALLGLLLAAPALASQDTAPSTATVAPAEVSTVLYFHALNPQDMPVNTQEPQEPAFQGSQGFGPTAATLTCLDGPSNGAAGGTTSQAFHTWYGYSSPSFVEYDVQSAGGEPRTHPERGLSYDVSLNRSAPVTLHWFLAEDLGGTAEDDVVPLANVAVHVTVRQGDSISPDDKAYDTGPTIMQGATPPVTALRGQVAGPGAALVSATQAQGTWVYDFAVPLTLHQDRISSFSGFTVRIDVSVDSPACPDVQDGSLMPATTAVFADAAHLPRIELRNLEPLRVDRATVASHNGTLRFDWDVRSAWGSYDVAVEAATLEVFGPADVQVTPAYTIQRTQEAFHHLEATHQGWTTPAADLPSGRYTAVFTMPNLQRTAVAEAQVTFYVQDGEVTGAPPQQSPGIPALGLLAATALAGLVVRRHAR